MCKICVEWQTGKLTNEEAMRNLGEIVGSEKETNNMNHYYDLAEKILDEEMSLEELEGIGWWWSQDE